MGRAPPFPSCWRAAPPKARLSCPIKPPNGPTPPTRSNGVAERPGFEPGVEFPPHTLSRRAPSTARTPLRIPAGDLSSGDRPWDGRYRLSPDVVSGLAERVGFEPTWELPPNPLSRRARYDHFGTSPTSPRLRLTLRHPFDQDDPIRRVLEGLHVRELAEQPAVEGLLAVFPDRHQRGWIYGLIRTGCDLVARHLQRR